MLLDRALRVPWDVALPLLVVLVLTALACACFVLVRARWPGGVMGGLVILAAVWWELENAPVEGKVLVAVERGHGVRLADVIALQAVFIGTALLIGPRRRVAQPGQ